MSKEPPLVKSSTVDIVDRKMALAKRYGPRTQELAERIARQVGGYTTPLNYKSKKSTLGKMEEVGGDISQIKDLARTTIIVPRNKIEETLAAFDNIPNVSRLKRQTPEKMSGYSGNIINLKYRGLETEIQVNTEKMIYAKEKMPIAAKILGAKRWREIRRETGMPGGFGHVYYEDFRSLGRGETKKTRRGRGAVTRMDSRIYYSFFQD